MDEEDYIFCYWDILDDASFYIGAVLTVCSYTFFLYLGWVNYMLYRSNKYFDLKVKIIFIHLLLWSATHFGKMLYGEIDYGFCLRYKTSRQDFLQTSKIFCVADSVSTCFLHGVLLIIPYIWTKNIVSVLIKKEIEKSQEEETGPAGVQTYKKTRIYLYFLKIYIVVRYFIYIALFITQITVKNDQLYEASHLWCRIINFYIIGEAGLCVAILIFGLYTLLENFKKLQLNDERDKVKILREFIFLISFCLIRVFFNFVFIFEELFLKEHKKNCIIKSINQLTRIEKIQRWVYLPSIIFTHLFPVLLVLKLYDLSFTRPKKRKMTTHSYITDPLLSVTENYNENLKQ